MSLVRRLVVLAVLLGGTLAPLAAADRATAALPPEATEGEWLEDSLNNPNLWFASSENLEFEPIAKELPAYPQGRRWVRVVDGRPAWVLYFIPGEILGFEVDTHHFAADGIDFRFAAGNDWKALTPLEVDAEEILDFTAKWLRLYRAADALPTGTRFLRIEFPSGADREAARLTEVWLRCRFESAVAVGESAVKATAPDSGQPLASEVEGVDSLTLTTIAPPAPNQDLVTPLVAPANERAASTLPDEVDRNALPPIVVRAILFDPPPRLPPVLPPIPVQREMPPVAVMTPSNRPMLDIAEEVAALRAQADRVAAALAATEATPEPVPVRPRPARRRGPPSK